MVGLDTSKWNLFRAGAWSTGIAIASMACGPVIDAPQGETDDPTGETDQPTDPSDPSDPSDPTIDPTQGDCVSDDDCSYGYSCINSFCQYDCYCGCGASPPPPGSQLRCSEGPGYECYSEYDCADDEDCVYGWCEPAVVDCGEIPVRATSTELFFGASEAVVSRVQLADVFPDPGQEVLAARGTFIEFASSTGKGGIAIEGIADILTFAAGDVDGDGLVDLVTAEDGDTAMLRVWQGNGQGFVETELVQPAVGVRALFIADRDADGVGDIYAHVGRDLVLFPSTEGVPLGEGVRLLESRVDAVATIDTKGDGETELLFADGSAIMMFAELQGFPPTPLLETDSEAFGSIVVADFSGDIEPDATVFGLSFEQFTFVGDVSTAASYAEASVPQTGSSATDVDGDGRADLAILEADVGSVLVRYGSELELPDAPNVPFRCDTRYTIDAVGHAIAGGDFDGDGRGELAIADGTRVVLVRF